MEDRSGTMLRKWNATYNERQKLQHVYLLIAAISFVVAAITSLINQHFGRVVLAVTLFMLGAFLANAVIWSLLYANVLANVKSRQPRR